VCSGEENLVRRLLRGLAAMLVATPIVAVAIVSAPPAGAQDNGVGLTPLLGWSSWSFIRRDPTAAKIEAQADAMVSSGLQSVGYRNVNVDDF
jgi:alpha-galactosidase